MTVGELMAVLNDLDPKLEVVVSGAATPRSPQVSISHVRRWMSRLDRDVELRLFQPSTNQPIAPDYMTRKWHETVEVVL